MDSPSKTYSLEPWLTCRESPATGQDRLQELTAHRIGRSVASLMFFHSGNEFVTEFQQLTYLYPLRAKNSQSDWFSE